MDLRVRAWGWVTRRQASLAARSEDDVIAMQRRGMPENVVTDLIFGKTPPGVAVANRSVPGPDGDIPVRVYRPAGAAAGRTSVRIQAWHSAKPAVGEAQIFTERWVVPVGDGAAFAG